MMSGGAAIALQGGWNGGWGWGVRVKTSSSRTTPPAPLAMMTALETLEVPRQTVDFAGVV
jgi:hypothetical protein